MSHAYCQYKEYKYTKILVAWWCYTLFEWILILIFDYISRTVPFKIKFSTFDASFASTGRKYIHVTMGLEQPTSQVPTNVIN
ncbi:hypothetical protein V1478_010767 [Vespula squamosa]|uniref:Uncharacterized protein n=1 Tax=Vespula squamosa TaxID=30214 RepID=A0ABD2AHH4_VESSQ